MVATKKTVPTQIYKYVLVIFLISLYVESCGTVCRDCYITRLEGFDNLRIKDYEIWSRNRTNKGSCFWFCYTDTRCVSFQHNTNTGICRGMASSFKSLTPQNPSPLSVETSSEEGTHLYLPCSAANRYGAECTSGTDCHLNDTSCVEGRCQCQTGLLLSPTSFLCVTPYVGRYEDDAARMLPSGNFYNSTMTIEFCLGYCKTNGHIYATLQSKQWCFCGDFLPSGYPQTDESECSETCFGNLSQICGGPFRNSVFLTGLHTAV